LIDAADATFATDNFKAGQLIGQWAAKTLGDKGKVILPESRFLTGGQIPRRRERRGEHPILF
jgi:ABC-type sugar transport system substrate-binding protein